ncbi:hypothetical protein [Mycoplasma procyoni]|uniref:hypothetical protein n=1 Tax=Mycoplasma procyoni TaxID=568784 RepID=UPI00197C480B|nr:hypothetical protein [Mycoplasma procyoni]MBN3535140.1 hypothetical protein [Mycoplasma procyoni]
MEKIINDINEKENVSFKWKLEAIDNNYKNWEKENLNNDVVLIFNPIFIKNDIWTALYNEFNFIVLKKQITQENLLEKHKNYVNKKFERFYWFMGVSIPSILAFIALIWSNNLLGNENRADSSGWSHTWQSILIIGSVFVFVSAFSVVLVLIIKWLKKIQSKDENKNNKR